MTSMVTAVLAGMSHRVILRSRDRTEVLVETLLAERVLERQEELEETRIHRMANEIAKRFGGN